MLEFIQIILIILLVAIVILLKEYKDRKTVLIIFFIYAYHILFASAYYNFPSDSHYYFHTIVNGYFRDSLISLGNITLGGSLIFYINNICIEYLHLSYLGTSLLYASLSFIGFWILFKIIQSYKIKYLWLCLFIPSLHFWSVGLGKESLIFFFISILLHGVVKNKLNYIFLGLLSIFIIRPHVGVLFGSAYIISILFGSNISLQTRLLVVITSLAFSWPVINFFFGYLGITKFSQIFDFALMMQRQNGWGGSSYKVAEYSNFFQVFTYLFRPFFESLKLTWLVASFDNLIYFSIFLWVIVNGKFIGFKDRVNIFLILSFFIFSLVMGFSIANLGIALRQKIMIMPFLILIFVQTKSNKIKFLKERTVNVDK